jgi:hypothetical protein
MSARPGPCGGHRATGVPTPIASKRSLSSGNDVDRTRRLVFSLLGPSLLDEGCALGSALNRCCCSRSALARALYPPAVPKRCD